MKEQERDPYTGHMMTGHEWNGIKELNAPVPRIVNISYVLAIACAVLLWILLPSFPIGSTFTPGILDIKQHTDVDEALLDAQKERAAWEKRIKQESFQEIAADPKLMLIIRQAGKALFGTNCAACHGLDGTGGPGYPNLTDKAWLWGGEPDQVMETLSVGINSANPDTRSSQMPAFGRDEMLPEDNIKELAGYVHDLSTSNAASAPESVKALFSDNCSACHGEDAKGSIEMGAPDLTDAEWIYGGDVAAVHTTIWSGRQGVMPSWVERLSEVDRKILTLYVLDLSKKIVASK